MSVLSPITSGILRDVTSSILSPSQRYFTTLVASGSMRYTIPAIELAGDYRITALVYFTGDRVRVYGSSAGFNSRLTIEATGAVLFSSSTATSLDLNTATGAVPENKLSTISVGRTGSSGFIEINGVEVATGVVSIVSAVIDLIGAQSTAFGDGIIANVNINDERIYKLDENFALTTVAKDSSGNGQNATAVAISSSDFYQLNAAGTIWINLSGGSDLVIA